MISIMEFEVQFYLTRFLNVFVACSVNENVVYLSLTHFAYLVKTILTIKIATSINRFINANFTKCMATLQYSWKSMQCIKFLLTNLAYKHYYSNLILLTQLNIKN